MAAQGPIASLSCGLLQTAGLAINNYALSLERNTPTITLTLTMLLPTIGALRELVIDMHRQHLRR
jgi:hypothetical protein